MPGSHPAFLNPEDQPWTDDNCMTDRIQSQLQQIHSAKGCILKLWGNWGGINIPPNASWVAFSCISSSFFPYISFKINIIPANSYFLGSCNVFFFLTLYHKHFSMLPHSAHPVFLWDGNQFELWLLKWFKVLHNREGKTKGNPELPCLSSCKATSKYNRVQIK